MLMIKVERVHVFNFKLIYHTVMSVSAKVQRANISTRGYGFNRFY